MNSRKLWIINASIQVVCMLVIFVCLMVGEAKAADWAPFATASVEHQFSQDDLIEPGCHFDNPLVICAGSNPQAEFKLGVEVAFGDWRNRWYVPVIQAGYKHRSHWLTGRPFNDTAETYSNALFIEFKFGGLR